jgi:hypothetical protein
MNLYAIWCGRALARSGLSAMLSGYMGKSEVFDEAMTASSGWGPATGAASAANSLLEISWLEQFPKQEFQQFFQRHHG